MQKTSVCPQSEFNAYLDKSKYFSTKNSIVFINELWNNSDRPVWERNIIIFQFFENLRMVSLRTNLLIISASARWHIWFSINFQYISWVTVFLKDYSFYFCELSIRNFRCFIKTLAIHFNYNKISFHDVDATAYAFFWSII